MTFRPIPDESAHADAAGFTTRPIRRAGEDNILHEAERLLGQFASEGAGMLASEMNDLVAYLHRAALLVQRTKHAMLAARLKKMGEEKKKR